MHSNRFIIIVYVMVRNIIYEMLCCLFLCSLPRDAVTKASCHIDICLKQQALARHMAGGMCDGALLLCGIRGVGKTSLASALCHQAISAPNYAFIRKVDCKLLRGL